MTDDPPRLTEVVEIKIGIRMGLWSRAVAPAGQGDGDYSSNLDQAVDAFVAALVAEYGWHLERIHEEFLKTNSWRLYRNPVLFGHLLAWRSKPWRPGHAVIGDGPKDLGDRIPGFEIAIESGALTWRATGAFAMRWISLDDHNRRAKALQLWGGTRHRYRIR